MAPARRWARTCATARTRRSAPPSRGTALLPGGCTEACDGINNDCDGIADEGFNAKGSNAANFVKPVVTKLAAALWMFTYEASRPTATNAAPGSGNGFWTSSAGRDNRQDRRVLSSRQIPWFNVTPQEVEQTCAQMGGAMPSKAQFQTACQPNAACTFGYNPRGGAGSACTTTYSAAKSCNLAPSYDFNAGVAGDQDGLLPTASNLLQNCWADWSNLQGNVAATNKLFDVAGNLPAIIRDVSPCGGPSPQPACVYKTMGGAFDTESEAGASCGFTFYTVASTFKFFDTGFRCCFTAEFDAVRRSST